MSKTVSRVAAFLSCVGCSAVQGKADLFIQFPRGFVLCDECVAIAHDMVEQDRRRRDEASGPTNHLGLNDQSNKEKIDDVAGRDHPE